MDIRSIIDSEDAPPVRKPSMSTPIKQEHPPSAIGFYDTRTPSYDSRRDIRPFQPPPLETSSRSDSQMLTMSPRNSVDSPYQRTPSFGPYNGHHPPTQAPSQSPHYSHQVLQYSQREGTTPSGPQSGRSLGHSTPLSQTPTASTPGSASGYSNFPRPTSSHSIPTPNSTHHSSSFLRESSQPSLSQSRALSQNQIGQQYKSQPATPLGPPALYKRPSLSHQISPGTYNYHRSLSGGYTEQEPVGASTAPGESPSAYREHQLRSQSLHERERSLSVSPKTKLPNVPDINRMNSMEHAPGISPARDKQYTTVTPEIEPDTPAPENNREPKWSRTPSRSVGLSGLLNAEAPSDSSSREQQSMQAGSHSTQEHGSEVQVHKHTSLSQSLLSQSSAPSDREFTQPQDSSVGNQPTGNPTVPNQFTVESFPDSQTLSKKSSSFKMAALKTHNILTESPLPKTKKTSRGSTTAKRTIQESSQAELLENDSSILSQPAKKKARIGEDRPNAKPTAAQTEKQQSQSEKRRIPKVSHWQEVPIFAQSVRGAQRTQELFERNLASARGKLSQAMQAPSTLPAKQSKQMNGNLKTHHQAPARSSPASGAPMPNPQAPSPSDGPLGPWEPTFNDTIVADEVTRVVADFIFPLVVLNEEIGVAPAGGGRGLGAVLEVEARIGRLIDKNTNDRLRLPVINECVISQADPNVRIAFESSMTERQHRNLNKFLNQALVDSQGSKSGSVAPRKPRIPMTYKHTHEVDTTYELSQQGAMQLPRSVADGLNLRPNAKNKARVRVTTDEKTGDVLAKIVKTKVADIHVYSPRTLFDWRISVNAEVDFDIDMNDLVAVETRDGKGVRRKDRVSYKHTQYQIDLTQVTPAEPGAKVEKVHELEVEVSSEEVRKHGLLVMNNAPNGYEDLIRGFVDNVRLLARFCKD